jgi:hypothetical protein
MQHPPSPEPAVTSSRRGLRLRHVDDGKRSYFEVANPGELERIKPSLTQAEYDAGLELRRLWAAGAMNPEPSSSCIDGLGPPRRGFQDHDDEHRLEAQDELRSAIGSMGGLGMCGRYAVEICCYERHVRTQDELLYLRQALSRLAEHLRQGRRAAA